MWGLWGKKWIESTGKIYHNTLIYDNSWNTSKYKPISGYLMGDEEHIYRCNNQCIKTISHSSLPLVSLSEQVARPHMLCMAVQGLSYNYVNVV